MLSKVSSAIYRLLSKNKMNSKIDSNHKESTPREIKNYYYDYGDPFHEAARNIAEISCKERVEQFIKKRLLSRSKFLWSHTTQHYSNAIEKRETEKGNIRLQRKPPGSSIICWKHEAETWGIQVPSNNLATSNLNSWGEIVSTKNQVSF